MQERSGKGLKLLGETDICGSFKTNYIFLALEEDPIIFSLHKPLH